KLNGFAGPSGRVVNLYGNAIKVQVPSSVMVPAQSKAVAFTTVTGGVTSTLVASPSAKVTGDSQVTGSLTLRPSGLLSLSLSKSSIVMGNNEVITARLDGVAGADTTVMLSCPNSDLNVPASITIPAGRLAAAVSFECGGTNTVFGLTSVTITGALAGVEKTVNLSVDKAHLVSVTAVPASVYSGNIFQVVLRLNGKAGPASAGGNQHGDFVTFSGTALTLLVFPPNVVIPKGSSALSVQFTARPSEADSVNATIQARDSQQIITGVTILHPVATSATCSPATGTTPRQVTVTVTMNGSAARDEGIPFTLSSSSGLVSYPNGSTLVIPKNARTGTLKVNIAAAAPGTHVQINCTGPASQGTVAAEFISS
ncbi:MAG: hypothetical protein ABUL72_07250, partial [Armatimonadota bacterium]